MVTHPGTAPGAGPLYRPLNLPRPATVRTDARGLPRAIADTRGGGPAAAVRALLDAWELDDEWWREDPIRRRYFRLLLADGRVLTVFCDLVGGGWFRQDV